MESCEPLTYNVKGSSTGLTTSIDVQLRHLCVRAHVNVGGWGFRGGQSGL